MGLLDMLVPGSDGGGLLDFLKRNAAMSVADTPTGAPGDMASYAMPPQAALAPLLAASGAQSAPAPQAAPVAPIAPPAITQPPSASPPSILPTIPGASFQPGFMTGYENFKHGGGLIGSIVAGITGQRNDPLGIQQEMAPQIMNLTARALNQRLVAEGMDPKQAASMAVAAVLPGNSAILGKLLAAPSIVPQGATAVNPNTGQVIGQGSPRSYPVPAGGELVTPGAAPTGNAATAAPNGATTYQNTNGMLDDKAIALQGERAMKGDFSVFRQTGFGQIGQINSAKVLNYMATHGATADQLNAANGTLQAQIKAQKDFGTGPQGNTVRSLNVAINHLDALRQYASALQNGNQQTINAAKNIFKEEFGYDAPTNFDALVPLVTGEVAKAVIGSNNAIADRQDLREALHNASSPSQLSGAIDAYERLMSGQMGGLRQQYEGATHQKDFNRFLSPRTQSVLDAHAPPKVTTQADTAAAIAAAKDAIAKGADPKAVNARLQEMGVPPLSGQ